MSYGYIDVEKHTAKEMYAMILKKVYKNGVSNDVYDPPASALLTPCDDLNSDYHLDFMQNSYDCPYSDDPLANATWMDERPREETRKTFVHKLDFDDTISYFGDALESHLEACTILTYFKKSHTNYKKWFKQQWGVNQDYDFTPFIPHLMGTTNKVFATTDKNPHPECTYNKNIQASFVVKSHSVNSKKDDVLIDWNRIREILTFIGVVLLVDGYKGKRLDYKLRKNLCSDPIEDFTFDDNQFVVNGEYDIDELVTDEIADYVNDYNEKMNNIRMSDHLDLPDDFQTRAEPIVDFGDFINEKFSTTVDTDEPGLVDDGNMFYDIDADVEIKHTTYIQPVIVETENVVEDYANIIVRAGKFKTVEALGDTYLKNRLWSDDVPAEIYDLIINPLNLEIFSYSMAKNARTKVWKRFQLGKLYNYLNFYKDSYSYSDFVVVCQRNRNNPEARKIAGRIYLRLLKRVHIDRCTFKVLDSDIFTYLRETGNMAAAASKFLEMRKIYWQNHYMMRDKLNEQVRANMVSAIVVKYPDKWYYSKERLEIVINKMRKNYKANKRKYEEKDDMYVDIQMNVVDVEDVQSVKNFLGVIDDEMAWEVKLKDVHEMVNKTANDMVKDVVDLFTTYNDYKGLEKEIKEKEKIPKKDKEKMTIIEPVIEELGGLFDDDGGGGFFDDFDDKVEVKNEDVDMVDTYDVLIGLDIDSNEEASAYIIRIMGERINRARIDELKQHYQDYKVNLLRSGVARKRDYEFEDIV